MYDRNYYLNELKIRQKDHLVKVIIGIRRCGKSFLLNNIFYNYLINEEKVDKNNIIRFAFDNEKDIALLDEYLKDQPTIKNINGQLVINNRKFLSYIENLTSKDGFYYLILDEIQNLENFVIVLN